MTHEFQGKIATTKVSDMNQGVQANVVVSTELFETDLEQLFKYQPEPKILLHVRLGEKLEDTFECEFKSARTASTKNGSFLYVTFSGKAYSGFAAIEKLVGQKVDLTMELPPSEQPELDGVAE